MVSWDVNWLAVLVAVVAHQVLGFLWYGPLFQKQWLAGLGKTKEEQAAAASGVAPAIMGGIVASIITVLSVALLLTAADDPDVATGLTFGFLASVGFGAANIVSGAAFEQRNMTVTWINAGYVLVGGLLIGAILGGWQ